MILIVAGNPELARIWARHLERQAQKVTVTTCASDAIGYMQQHSVDVLVLDLMLEQSSAFSVADYDSYRWPDTKIVFVNRTTFFSDGSLFRHVPNTAAIIQEDAPPSDLAEIVSYYGRVC